MDIVSSNVPAASVTLLDEPSISSEMLSVPDLECVLSYLKDNSHSITKTALRKCFTFEQQPLSLNFKKSLPIYRILQIMVRHNLIYDIVFLTSTQVTALISGRYYSYILGPTGHLICTQTNKPVGLKTRMFKSVLLPLYYVLEYPHFVDFVINQHLPIDKSPLAKNLYPKLVAQYLNTGLISDASSDVFVPQLGEVTLKAKPLSFLDYLFVIYVYFSSIYFMSRFMTHLCYTLYEKVYLGLPPYLLKSIWRRFCLCILPDMPSLALPEPFCNIPGYTEVRCFTSVDCANEEYMIQSNGHQYMVTTMGFDLVAREAMICGSHTDLIYRCHDGKYLVLECKRGRRKGSYLQARKHASTLVLALNQPVYYASFSTNGFIPYGIIDISDAKAYLSNLKDTSDLDDNSDELFDSQIGEIDIRNSNVFLTQYPSEGDWNEVRRKTVYRGNKPVIPFNLPECEPCERFIDQERFFTPSDFALKRSFVRSDAKKIVYSKRRAKEQKLKQKKQKYEIFEPQMGEGTGRPPLSKPPPKPSEIFFGDDFHKPLFKSTYVAFGNKKNTEDEKQQKPIVKDGQAALPSYSYENCFSGEF